MGCIPQKEGGGLGPAAAPGRRPRRNARSMDLCAGGEPGKAAAWLWHMHTSCNSPSFSNDKLDVQSVWESRTRSSSFSRVQSRFQQEAAAAMAMSSASPSLEGAVQSTRVWDCGSKLYDSFELVSFSNRLDRSLLGIIPPPSPPPAHGTFAGVLRTFSLPIDFSPQTSMPMAAPSSAECASAADLPHDAPRRISEEACGHGFDLQQGCLNNFHGQPSHIAGKPSSPHQHLTARCALSKLVRKLLKSYTHLQCIKPPAPCRKMIFKCRKSCDEDVETGTATSERSWRLSSSGEAEGERRCDAMEEEDDNGRNREFLYRVDTEKAKWRKGEKHFHHHHHHYHHHFVHHVDQFSLAARDGNVCKLPVTMDSTLRNEAASLHAESARLSCDTLAKLCADVNWN